MSTLVFLEHHGNELLKGSLGVLSKAASLGDTDVAGVIAGSGVRALADGAGKFGAAKVYVADDAQLEAPLPQPRVDVLAQLVRDQPFDTVLFANSVLAADVAAGLAARLDAGLNWDLTDVVRENGKLVGKRPALQDSVYVDVGWTSEPRLALFRPGSFDPNATGGTAEVEDLQVGLEDFSTAARMIDQAHEESEGPTIEDAEVIVAGGRGLGVRRTSRWSRSSPRHWAVRSARRAPSSTRAGTRMRRRSGRPERRSHRSSTLPAGFPGRSSTRSACRARA